MKHTDASAPAVSEQAGFQHMMPGHTTQYCLALTELYAATGDEVTKRKALEERQGGCPTLTTNAERPLIRL